jgi:hypothetical protein
MFTDEPETVQPSTFTPVIRPRPGQPQHLLITGEPKWCFTHYLHGRTWPCIRGRCPFCRRSIPKRQHAYYPALMPGHKRAVLELTALRQAAFNDAHITTSDFSAGVYAFSLESKSKNAAFQVNFTEANDKQKELIKQEGNHLVEHTMSKIWQLPKPLTHDADAYTLQEIRTFLEARCFPNGSPETAAPCEP